MFEWIFTCLLRLYPSWFREVYADEIRWLIRERLHDEKGMLRKSRLCLDLVMDFAVGVFQAYRTVPSEATAVSAFPNTEGIPFFHVLNERKAGLGPLLLGSGFSLAALYLFSFILNLPSPYQPLSGSNGPISPIEAVLERLNQPVPARSSATESDSVSNPHRAMLRHETRNATIGQDQAVPIQRQSPTNRFDGWGRAMAAFKMAPEGYGPHAEAPSGRSTFTVAAQSQIPLSPGGATAGCVLASNSQVVRPRPELLLYHPTGPLSSYEVATVRPVAPDIASGMVKLPPGGSLSTLTIRRYIMDAYGAVYPPQVVGGPNWLNKDAYAIKGKIPDELESAFQKMTLAERVDQIRMMKQCLLADRFHLKAHFESRILPVYELVPAKGGLKITKASAPAERRPGDSLMRPRASDSLAPGSMTTSINGNGLRVLNGRAIQMQLLARVIAGDVGGRPIVNHTGFAGYFDITDLTWAPLSDTGSASDSDAPSIQGALKEKLGIRIVPARDPIEVLVIDSIERPTPN